MVKQANSEIFLSTFNELEKHFKNEFFRGQWKSFKQMLKEGSRFNPIIRKFKEELFEFTDLRNAIVHNRNHQYQVIAEPHTVVVEQFLKISETIINPIKVDKFCKKVQTCLINDPIAKPIALINQYKISQIPILDKQGHVYEILNATNVAYWIASRNYKFNENDTIQSLLDLKEVKRNYQIISKGESVYHAAELYKDSFRKGTNKKYFDALLITLNGNANEEILGIIVLADIALYI